MIRYKEATSGSIHTEKLILWGKDAYIASKSSQDIVVSSFREGYFTEIGVGVSTVRAGNVIGGGYWGAHRIVPYVVRGLMDGNIIRIRNPDSVRPWQYVLEPISGMLLLAQRMRDDILELMKGCVSPQNGLRICMLC